MTQSKKQSKKIGNTSRSKMLRMADVVRSVRIPMSEMIESDRKAQKER